MPCTVSTSTDGVPAAPKAAIFFADACVTAQHARAARFQALPGDRSTWCRDHTPSSVESATGSDAARARLPSSTLPLLSNSNTPPTSCALPFLAHKARASTAVGFLIGSG